MASTRILRLAVVLVGAMALAGANVFGQVNRSELDSLMFFKTYTSHRVSSFDRTGANDDGMSGNKIQPGESRTIADLAGPGVITHIWFTIATPEAFHLKKIVMRIYWDGESTPSVEAPVGDFFGLGLGKYVMYESGPLSVGSQKALNSYFAMPFRRAARIVITNDGQRPIDAFYFNIDYQTHRALPDDVAYFHAQFRQATPNKGWTSNWTSNGDDIVDKKPNLTGEGNYVILDAEGRGHFVGVTHSLLQNQSGWWGEGDDMMYIDGAAAPQINGTGSEDYYLGAWCYGGCGINPFGNVRPTFAYSRYGNPVNGGDGVGAEWTVYRFHTDNPVTFEKSLKVTIESGHANARSDNFYTVAFWYQSEPHKAFPALPDVNARIPRQIPSGGPTNSRQ